MINDLFYVLSIWSFIGLAVSLCRISVLSITVYH